MRDIFRLSAFVTMLFAINVGVAEQISEGGEESKPAARRVVLDKVIAVVGGSSILASDLSEFVQQLDQQRRREGYTSERSLQSEAMEQLLTQKLLYNQGLLDSVEVSDVAISTSVENRLNAMREQAGGLVELESTYNMEIFNIRELLRRSTREQYIADQMRNRVISEVTIIPGEVEKYYNSRDRDSLPMIGEQYKYAQITRFPSSIDDAKRRIKERLLGMREKIISGEAKFNFLAQMYSLDPGSAYRGGEMEPQPANAFVGAFADALEMLQPGLISEVVETEFGFHIIELIDKRGDLYHCRHILLRPEYTTEELMEPINFLDSLANEIRKDSISFDKAAQLYSDDKSSKMNGGVVTNHDLLERYNAYDAKLTVTKFLKEDFGNRGYKSLDDLNALMKLGEGEISDAFTTQDMVGNQLSKIVKMVKLYPAHRASIDEDYARLEDIALNAKTEEELKRWLNKTIAKIYIYIDPEYRDLEYEHEWVK
ncbi:MAG: peptidylprolyl isomerase [Rikenellaceae bacterium]